MVKLNVKTNSMHFEDKRIEANAGWNIKELKGKLSELYPTVRTLISCWRTIISMSKV